MTAPSAPTLADVLPSLELAREQLKACYLPFEPIENCAYQWPKYLLRLNLKEALERVEVALEVLSEMDIHPAPTPPRRVVDDPFFPSDYFDVEGSFNDEPETDTPTPELSARERALVEAARVASDFLERFPYPFGASPYSLLEAALEAYTDGAAGAGA